MLTTIVTLTGILVIVLALVIGILGLVLWTRYAFAIEADRHVEALIDANRATPRPGMAAPDRRFRVVARRRARGPYAR
jgi:hypothetical protein